MCGNLTGVDVFGGVLQLDKFELAIWDCDDVCVDDDEYSSADDVFNGESVSGVDPNIKKHKNGIIIKLFIHFLRSFSFSSNYPFEFVVAVVVVALAFAAQFVVIEIVVEFALEFAVNIKALFNFNLIFAS